MISAAQAYSGDPADALRTAALLEEDSAADNARRLIAIRLAQRGNFTRAAKVIEELPTSQFRDGARVYLALELLKRKRYHDCLHHYAGITADSDRRDARVLMHFERQKLPVSHPNFVERSVELARRSRPFFLVHLSEHEEGIVRLTLRAKVALNAKNRPEFDSILKEAKQELGELEFNDRCSLLFGLGTVCTEFNETETARTFFADMFDLIFAARDEDGQPLILPPGVGLGREPQWRAIAMAFTSDDLIDLAERMRNSPYGDDYLSSFAGGLGEAEKFDVAAKVFSQITSPQGRLQFCAFFLGGLAQRANSLRKEETEWTPTEQDAASLTILDQILEGNPQPEFDFREDEKN
ncbi:MAG: hypothetical protein KF777_03765 [Planctomycetaceae bacterium]|nr:hypothetical protein [Planctomycetaceae bacterium]